MAARVSGKKRWSKASPQPVRPASVTTRTSSMSMLVRARPPSIGVAPSITIGRLMTSVSTRVIFMRSEADRQGFQPAQRQALAMLGPVGGQRKLGQPLHERVDRDLALDPRQRGAETEVDAPAEGDVAIVGPPDVEAIGFGELGGIAVGGTDERHHHLALADRPT